MTDHTPGPWITKWSRSPPKIVGPNNELIAKMPVWEGQKVKWERQKFNARLIAAAPDLLEALYNLISLASPHMTDSTQTLAMEQARAAMAKATEGTGL